MLSQLCMGPPLAVQSHTLNIPADVFCQLFFERSASAGNKSSVRLGVAIFQGTGKSIRELATFFLDEDLGWAMLDGLGQSIPPHAHIDNRTLFVSRSRVKEDESLHPFDFLLKHLLRQTHPETTVWVEQWKGGKKLDWRVKCGDAYEKHTPMSLKPHHGNQALREWFKP